jgi:hypothetical protein
VKDKTESEKHIAEAKLREFLAKLSQNKQNAKASTNAQTTEEPQDNN